MKYTFLSIVSLLRWLHRVKLTTVFDCCLVIIGLVHHFVPFQWLSALTPLQISICRPSSLNQANQYLTLAGRGEKERPMGDLTVLCFNMRCPSEGGSCPLPVLDGLR